MTLSSKTVQEFRDQLFSTAYLAPELFANRKEERELLEKLVNDSGSAAPVIAEPLGVGKTYLAQVSVSKLPPDTIGRVSMRYPFDVLPSWSASERIRWVVIDEIDNRVSRTGLDKRGKIIHEFLDSHPAVVPFLVGDAALLNPETVEIVLPSEWLTRTSRVSLRTLDWPFFREALKQRVHRFICSVSLANLTAYYDHVEGSQGRASCPLSPDIFDTDFLSYLFPSTDPSVATFRDALKICGDIAGFLRSSDEAACIGQADFHAYLTENPRYDPGVYTEFCRGLYEFIVEEFKPDRPMRAMTAEELKSKVPLGGRYSDVTVYDEEILQALSEIGPAGGVLKPFGVPWKGDPPSRIQGPYLPSPLSFLIARYGKGAVW